MDVDCKMLLQAVAAQLDKLAQDQDTAQADVQNKPSDKADLQDAASTQATAADTQTQHTQKKSEGAALSWPKRSKHKT